MDLNQLQIYPRIRNHWSAIDMGVRLARRWYGALFWGWFLAAGLSVLVLSVSLFWVPWGVIIGLWWLKPLFDRIPLFIASRRLFGQRLTLRDALKQGWPQLRKDFLLLLTWRRLSPSRSFDQPVTVLENLSGVRRQRRLQQLHNAGFAQSCWLTWVCAALEWAGYLACYALIHMMIPESFQVEFSDVIAGESITAHFVSSLITMLVVAMVAPFYVMGGFLLYLNRRIALEGWDIELQFRALAQRLAQYEQRVAGLANQDSVAGNVATASSSAVGVKHLTILPVLLSLGILLFSSGFPLSASAAHRSGMGPVSAKAQADVEQIAPKPGSERAQVRQTLDAILSGSDFHAVRLEKQWQRRGGDEPRLVYAEWYIRLIEWLEAQGVIGDVDDESDLANDYDLKSFARLLEIVLWIVFVVLVVGLVYRYRRALLAVIASVSHQSWPDRRLPPITEIQGLDIRPETLPDDVPTKVRQLVKSGEARQGLALLYRASLSRLTHRWQVPFARHHTENDCLRLVESGSVVDVIPDGQHERLTVLFATIVQLWTRCAYGHQAPDVLALERALAQWSEVFEHGQ